LAATFNAQIEENKATKIEFKDWNAVYGGGLYITTNGKEKKIADNAVKAWIINGGKDVVYVKNDGAGGFENEGQSLRIYQVQYDQTRKILSEYYVIATVAEKRLSDGQLALLVRMVDDGLGGSYFAVVDPDRGEVFFSRWAELMEISGDWLTLGYYKADDFETINKEREHETKLIPKPTSIEPYKKETHDLKTILQNEVIYNEKENHVDPPDRSGLTKVKIYLWRANDEFNDQNYVLSPVPRYVDPQTRLRSTLEALFAGETADEADNGFDSSTFGMKFQGVLSENGTVIVKFSQPPNQTNYGTLGPLIFLEAIRKTAMQFPNVKNVEVCAIGESLIDAQLEEPFPRCPQ
jgi:hypothetical protein